MARDYKYRSENRNVYRRKSRSGRRSRFALWRWMLITGLIIGFVVFLFYLGSHRGKPVNSALKASPAPTDPQKGQGQSGQLAEADTGKKTEAKPEPENPQFQFYTVLTGDEAVVADHEIDTRSREERIGQAKKSQYYVQAGSFTDFSEAERFRATLALMGIESQIEKTKVGKVTWHRIKMGPFTRMRSANSIRSRLKKNGIDALVVEIKD